jgi:Mg2+ and Co2+ transporter CorA
MNTKGLPMTENPDGFLIAMLICLASSIVVYQLLRRLGVR